MTVPEENRPKTTRTTDQGRNSSGGRKSGAADQGPGATSRARQRGADRPARTSETAGGRGGDATRSGQADGSVGRELRRKMDEAGMSAEDFG
ncbi:hypothetical protein [Streptomyces sp. NPDC003077]|uniref:hypothetical protein n=1 Tax=Streptomyces sp. NPDC003077 TaxID=3154443 RepID=UPI0033A5F0BE